MEEGAATTLTFQFKSLSFPTHAVILPQPFYQISTSLLDPLGALLGNPSVLSGWHFLFLVGLESANFSVLTLTARLLLPLFMQAILFGSGHTELIYLDHCRIYLPVEGCEMPW
jgi:hypothetical protein